MVLKLVICLLYGFFDSVGGGMNGGYRVSRPRSDCPPWHYQKFQRVSTFNWLKVETVSTFNSLKVETVSTFNLLKVETVSTLNWLKVETVSTFKHFHIYISVNDLVREVFLF